MFLTSDVLISNLIVHSVGNKLKGDSLFLSSASIAIGSELEEILTKFMFSPFKSNELFNFEDLAQNPVYNSVKTIFESSDSFVAESKKIATYLFEEANNPKMNASNLFVAYLKGIIINDNACNAIGIFKSEASDTFLKVKQSSDRVAIEKDAGINTSKLAKGALIFNLEEDNGFVISLVDKHPKNEEVSYWSENFLDIIPRQDSYYQTKNAMGCIEHFVSNGLPDIYSNVDRSQQVELLNRSLEYFQDNDEFDWDGFAKEIFVKQEIIEELGNYKDSFEQDNDVKIAETFEINIPAVKKQAKIFKSIIKLDDKFDIVIHKGKENLIRGKDKESGLNFYQLLFKTEE